jgi:hypothetical protein
MDGKMASKRNKDGSMPPGPTAATRKSQADDNEPDLENWDGRPYGSDDDGFNRFSKAYKENPSIEQYVKLRRENPDAEIEIGVMGGIDPLFAMEPELKKHGFDPHLVARVMGAAPDAQKELSLQLMERIIEARGRSRRGETAIVRRGLAVPDKLIDWLIEVVLDAMSWNDSLEIPRELIVLIRERLGGSNSVYRQRARTRAERNSAITTAARLIAMGEKPSLRLIGKLLGVEASTIQRWFPNGDFLKRAERRSHWFDETGQFTDDKIRPRKNPKKPLRRK